jgi:autotransporter adhesin
VYSSAFGNLTTSASGTYSVALGSQANSAGASSSALGDASTAAGAGDVAIGARATTTTTMEGTQTGGNIAIGSSSGAAAGMITDAHNQFVGTATTANGGNAIAIGTATQATGANTVALGAGSSATGANSVALGAGSSDGGQANVVSVGSANATRRITNLAAGVAGTDAVNVNQLNAMAAATLANANGYTDTQIAGVRFDLAQMRTEAQRGVAAAMALTSAPFPSAPGKTSYAANTAIYRGQVAFSASLSYRLDTSSPFALTGGVSVAAGNDVGGRVGVAGEF